MAAASNNHRIAAVMRALDMPSRMPPNARLWLALAAMKCDDEGRTSYSVDGHSAHTHDTLASTTAGITWLLEHGLVGHTTTDTGEPCWQLAHYDDWHRDHATIGGYGPDRGLKRDGLPPAYGRPIDMVIDPPTGKQNFPVPSWDQIAETIHREETT